MKTCKDATYYTIVAFLFLYFLPSKQKHISSIQQPRYDSASSALLQLPKSPLHWEVKSKNFSSLTGKNGSPFVSDLLLSPKLHIKSLIGCAKQWMQAETQHPQLLIHVILGHTAHIYCHSQFTRAIICKVSYNRRLLVTQTKHLPDSHRLRTPYFLVWCTSFYAKLEPMPFLSC